MYIYIYKMNYKEKYFKYKLKYLNLKNNLISGGGRAERKSNNKSNIKRPPPLPHKKKTPNLSKIPIEADEAQDVQSPHSMSNVLPDMSRELNQDIPRPNLVNQSNFKKFILPGLLHDTLSALGLFPQQEPQQEPPQALPQELPQAPPQALPQAPPQEPPQEPPQALPQALPPSSSLDHTLSALGRLSLQEPQQKPVEQSRR